MASLLPAPSMLAVFLAATVALNLSPGPDMLYVISRTLEQGKRAGIASALGIGAGTLVHTLVTAIGLSAILLSIPIAYQIIRYAGAAYLVFLGLRTLTHLRGRNESESVADTSNHMSLKSVFRQGVTTNVLNPKVALFFLAFLPQFVDSSKGLVALQIVLLGLLFDSSGTTWNIIVATLAGRLSDSLRSHSSISRIQKVLPAIILIALGFLVVL